MFRIRICFNVDPNPAPAFYLNADPDADPRSQTNADPGPSHTSPSQKVGFGHEKIYLIYI